MSWNLCHNVLVSLAARKSGKTYEKHGIWYEAQFDWGKEAWYFCYVCQERIITYPIADTPYPWHGLEEVVKKHGMQHLRSSNLLPFL